MPTIVQIMTSDVRVIGPGDSIQEAARVMNEIDVGMLPVADNKGLGGIVTDRDITVRAVAQGMSPATLVSEVMSTDVKYCFVDDEVDLVVENMGNIQVRRLPVLDRENQLVGIVSLSDIATKTDPAEAAIALSGISERGGQHNQSD